jgi:hypothetical protein
MGFSGHDNLGARDWRTVGGGHRAGNRRLAVLTALNG